MSRLIQVVAVSALLFLTACGEEVHDVEYYYTHFDELESQFKKCLQNPGEAAQNPNCTNVGAVYDRERMAAMLGEGGRLTTEQNKILGNIVSQSRAGG